MKDRCRLGWGRLSKKRETVIYFVRWRDEKVFKRKKWIWRRSVHLDRRMVDCWSSARSFEWDHIAFVRWRENRVHRFDDWEEILWSTWHWSRLFHWHDSKEIEDIHRTFLVWIWEYLQNNSSNSSLGWHFSVKLFSCFHSLAEWTFEDPNHRRGSLGLTKTDKQPEQHSQNSSIDTKMNRISLSFSFSWRENGRDLHWTKFDSPSQGSVINRDRRFQSKRLPNHWIEVLRMNGRNLQRKKRKKNEKT